MEPKGSLLFLQKHTTLSYPLADEYITSPPIMYNTRW